MEKLFNALRGMRDAPSIFTCALTAVFAASSANSATITVSSLADDVFVNAAGATFSDTALTVPVVSTACTLRMALAAANLDLAVGGCTPGAGADVVDIPISGTIEVANQSMDPAPVPPSATPSWLLFASNAVAIQGPASGTLVVSGASAGLASGKRILVMSNGSTTSDASMAISRIRFEKGRSVGGSGGCVFSRESLTLTDVVFDRCESVGVAPTSGGFGGALGVFETNAAGNARPNVTLTRVKATGNRVLRGTRTSRTEGGFATLGGGGSNWGGAITVTEGEFTTNSAERYGALFIAGVTSVTMTDTLTSGNHATGIASESAGRQGGFGIVGVDGDVNIMGGGVTGNLANDSRAGFSVFTVGGTVSISDVIVFGNLALAANVGGFEVSTDDFNPVSPFNCLGTKKNAVNITNVTVRGNIATTDAGGMRLFCSGAVTMNNVSLEANEVQGSQTVGVGSGNGAANIFDNNSVNWSNSTISGNKTFASLDPNTSGFGMVRVANNGSFVGDRLVVKGNWVRRNEGGMSIRAGANGQTATISNSSFYDNRAEALTALWLSGPGVFTLQNTTIAGNSSTTTAGGGAFGINTWVASGQASSLTFENVTIARNGPNDNAISDGGFGVGLAPNFTLNVKNSIFGQHRFGVGPVAFLTGGAGYTYNIQNSLFEGLSFPSGICGSNNVVCNVDAKLESLTNSGGDTMVLPLRAGSPALDSGAATALTTDQRGAGFPRVVGAAADMGAYESPVLAAALPCKLDMDGDNQVSATKEGLVLLRAMLGFSEVNAVASSGITQSQWSATRTNLNANCGTNFAP
jgi:hypothetical protein